MTDRFTFRPLNRIRTALKAAAIALPALWMTAQHYNWPTMAGIALGTAILTVRRGGGLSDAFHRASEKRAMLAANPPAIPATREQAIGDQISARFGLSGVEIKGEQPAVNAFIFTDGAEIHINRDLSKTLNDQQLGWIIAHETTHIKSLSDEYIPVPLHAAADMCLGYAALGVGVAGLKVLTDPVDGGALSGIAIPLAASLMLRLSALTVNRDIERHCDANALRATGDLQGAKGGLLLSLDFAQKLAATHPAEPLTPGEMIKDILFRPIDTHPTTRQRIRHLEKTWTAMQTESKGSPTPPAPGPVMHP